MGKTKELPAGVSWEYSPLFDFYHHPQMLFTGMCRQLQVTWLALSYIGVLKKAKKVSLLDVACGFGEVKKILQSQRLAKGARVRYVGIEADPRKEERARKLMPSIDFRLGLMQNVIKLSAGEKFDAIISSESLEHISKRDGIKFLRDCAKLLKRDGVMIITCPNQHYSHRENPWHMYEWPHEELTEHVKKTGWKILDQFFISSPVRKIKAPESISHRMPNEMIRGVMSPASPDGSVTVLVLTR